MKIKTIFIIVLTAIITIILMKNTDSVEFWIFGTYYIPKLGILAFMFLTGIVVGLFLSKSNKKKTTESASTAYIENEVGYGQNIDNEPSKLSKEDEDYIK